MARLGLSLSDVKVQTGNTSGFSIVPTGVYTVCVGSSEVKDTKNGSALILGYKILEGEHEGKLIKDFLNIVNPSAEAQRIAHERLATVVWATNAPLKNGKLEDSDDLLDNEAFEISVTQEDDGEYKNMRVKAVICTRSLEEKKPEPTKKASAPWKK